MPAVNEWLHRLVADEKRRAEAAAIDMRGPRMVAEQATVGPDEALQGLASDGYGSLAQVGLRWPFAPARAASEGVRAVGRYLAVTSQLEIPQGDRRRIRGARILRKIGWRVAQSPADGSFTTDELEVQTAGWRFRDGAMSFHLREIPPMIMSSVRAGPGPFDSDGFAFRMAQVPALLYETAHFPIGHLNAQGKPDFYVFLDGYTPPNAGRPWGNSLANWGTFYDGERAPWRSSTAWHALDVTVEGPATVALFVSNLQSNPAGRLNLPAAGATFVSSGTAPEEAFLLNYTHAAGFDVMEWRIATSLVWENA
jgi:hypothetical protein